MKRTQNWPQKRERASDREKTARIVECLGWIISSLGIKLNLFLLFFNYFISPPSNKKRKIVLWTSYLSLKQGKFYYGPVTCPKNMYLVHNTWLNIHQDFHEWDMYLVHNEFSLKLLLIRYGVSWHHLSRL